MGQKITTLLADPDNPAGLVPVVREVWQPSRGVPRAPLPSPAASGGGRRE